MKENYMGMENGLIWSDGLAKDLWMTFGYHKRGRRLRSTQWLTNKDNH